MSWNKIAEGQGTARIKNLSRYEGEMVENARGKVILNLRFPVSPSISRNLENTLRNAGVKNAGVTSSGNRLEIRFRKGFGFLAIIATMILASLALAILIVSWQFWQEITPIVSPFTINIAIIVGAILLIFIMWKTRNLSLGGVL